MAKEERIQNVRLARYGVGQVSMKGFCKRKVAKTCIDCSANRVSYLIPSLSHSCVCAESGSTELALRLTCV